MRVALPIRPMSHDSLRHVPVQGEVVPALGFGTWTLEGSDCVEAVVDALSLGYRLVDTAQAYGNEAEVGTGIQRAGIDRRDVWVTKKVAWDRLGYDACIESARLKLHAVAPARPVPARGAPP